MMYAGMACLQAFVSVAIETIENFRGRKRLARNQYQISDTFANDHYTYLWGDDGS
jgi:hypothetical protein